jgi:Fusaric acid resistance protein family
MPDQSVLSDRVKAAMKTALAMVLAYGIALSMDWDNPHWAGFAVAFCSLSTVGESLNKGLLRLSGTLLGGLAAFTLIALFPQDRWLFLICMSVFIGFCIFMMFGTSRRYFWQVAGLSVPLLALAGGANAPNDFQAVILRTEETALGILSYSLVWLLIWPASTHEVFEDAVRRLVTVHRQLTSLYLTSTSGEPHDVEVDALRREATQVLARLGGLLDGAEIDSYETWEARHAWRGLIQQLSQLTGACERWRQSFPEVRELDGQRLMPELPRLAAELDRRFAEIEHMLDGHSPACGPASVPLNFEENGVASLSQFHQAALLVYRTHLQAIDTLTRNLFETVAGIRNFTPANVAPIRDVVPLLPSALDPENLSSIARWLTGLWLTVLISLYVPGLPDTVIFIVLTNSILIALCVMPQVPIAVAFLPYVFGSALGSAINVLVMPHLTSFASLAVVIFAAVFSICWLFSRPTQIVGKMAGLGLLLLQMSVKNEQTYSFLDIANFAVASLLFFLAVAVSTHFPVSFRPEHVFLRLVGRFFRACAYLASTPGWDPTSPLTVWQRLRRAFCLRDLTTVPGKLAIWGSALPAATLGRSTAEQVQALIDSLQALANRMQDLIEARARPQSQVLVRELFSEVRAWRTRLQEILCNLSQQPEAADFADFRAQLDATLERLEGQIAKAVAGADQSSISTQENENSFCLLGLFRGVSEALVNFAKQARAIDWAHLREDRF